VEFSETKGLLTLVRIERELSELLGVKVYLLTEESISPCLIDGIKREAKVISTCKRMILFTSVISSIQSKRLNNVLKVWKNKVPIQ
jgi:hypothetical protein